jgi:large subunit ribosomal protein L4
VTFAASNRSYQQKLNKKMYRAGMRSILSELLRQGRIVVADDIVPAEAKTKALLSRLGNVAGTTTVIVTEAPDEKLYLAARNVPGIEVLTSDTLNPVALVHTDRVIVTSAAAKRIEVGLS